MTGFVHGPVFPDSSFAEGQRANPGRVVVAACNKNAGELVWNRGAQMCIIPVPGKESAWFLGWCAGESF